MPRGWRDSQRPDTGESQRGRPRLFKRKPSDNESSPNGSSPPAVSAPYSYYFEQKPSVNETTNNTDLAKSPTVLDASLNIPSNMTGNLVYNNESNARSPVSLQQEAKPTPHSTDGAPIYPWPVAESSSNISTKVTSPSSVKPLSLLHPLAGVPSNGGIAGSVTLSSSAPQWMQFLNKQDTKSDAPDGLLQLKDKIEKHSNWEKEKGDLLRRQQSLEEELQQVKQAKEEAEQRVANLETELRVKGEHINELERTLSTAQQALEEYRRKEPCDWVISRDEIHMTDNCLGVGGWGTVFMGRFRGCKVAVKQIHELILSPHNRRLFEREMNIASRCRHPCLLQFIGATNDEGSPLFVTEVMESSLRALLEQRHLSPTDISIISLDIAQALNYLHKSEPPIIHRDISSANVLLWRQGEQWRGKVSDYGTANFMQHTMTVAPGAMIYSAPEALTSNQTVKIDVYSFGVLLGEMCIRELPDPNQREEQVALVTNHVFRGLVRRCIQTNPEERPNMEEIIHEMESS